MCTLTEFAPLRSRIFVLVAFFVEKRTMVSDNIFSVNFKNRKFDCSFLSLEWHKQGLKIIKQFIMKKRFELFSNWILFPTRVKNRLQNSAFTNMKQVKWKCLKIDITTQVQQTAIFENSTFERQVWSPISLCLSRFKSCFSISRFFFRLMMPTKEVLFSWYLHFAFNKVKIKSL